MRLPGARRIGLQGWLGAATVAVGLMATLTMLLVLLPQLEGGVRSDRAARQSDGVRADLIDGARSLRVDADIDADVLADEIAQAIGGGEVRITRSAIVFSSPDEPRLLDRDPTLELQAARQSRVPEVRVARTAEGDFVRGAVAVRGPGELEASASIEVIAPVPTVEAEIGLIRQRVTIVVIAVLVLASLAGYVIARLLGRRIANLAFTASTLAGGELAARAPDMGPRELSSLSHSINRMAGRLQHLVAEITHDRDRAERLIAALAEGVAAVDADGAVTVANSAARRYLGLSGAAEPSAPGALPGEVMGVVREAAATGSASGTVVLDGAELEVDAAALGQGAAGVVLTLRDVTNDRRLERARRDLVANVSHELKTPLAAIKGFQELLEDDALPPATRGEFLALMSQEIVRLERLIEDQLQLARLDSGAFPLECEPVDLGALAEEVAAPRRILAGREGVALAVYVARGAPVMVTADPARIEQIILILLDNALRHTPHGGRIRVSVERGGDGAAISVTDDGEGIADEAQPFVFDRFYRGDSSRAGRSAGLGLAIARGLAEAHGGIIELNSMVGVGSTFTLRLPVAPPHLAETTVLAVIPRDVGQ